MAGNIGARSALSYYERGSTSLFAAQADQRFSFCLHVPATYDENGDQDYPLIVLVHGTERGAQRYRDEFVEFAEREQCIVLAPLFPCGIIDPADLDNYKFIEYRGIRFDLILLAMIDQIAERYRLRSRRFLIHGFSGGGHFVHRFLYLHPQRLRAASIGAPGMVTLLDSTKPWWVGTGGIEPIFGTGVDLDALRQVAVQMIVGDADTETWEITIPATSRLWMEGINDAGRTRIDRLTTLAESFRAHGIKVRFDQVPGVTHQGWHPALLAKVQEFLSAALAQDRKSP